MHTYTHQTRTRIHNNNHNPHRFWHVKARERGIWKAIFRLNGEKRMVKPKHLIYVYSFSPSDDPVVCIGNNPILTNASEEDGWLCVCLCVCRAITNLLT